MSDKRSQKGNHWSRNTWIDLNRSFARSELFARFFWKNWKQWLFWQSDLKCSSLPEKGLASQVLFQRNLPFGQVKCACGTWNTLTRVKFSLRESGQISFHIRRKPDISQRRSRYFTFCRQAKYFTASHFSRFPWFIHTKMVSYIRRWKNAQRWTFDTINELRRLDHQPRQRLKIKTRNDHLQPDRTFRHVYRREYPRSAVRPRQIGFYIVERSHRWSEQNTLYMFEDPLIKRTLSERVIYERTRHHQAG